MRARGMAPSAKGNWAGRREIPESNSPSGVAIGAIVASTGTNPSAEVRLNPRCHDFVAGSRSEAPRGDLRLLLKLNTVNRQISDPQHESGKIRLTWHHAAVARDVLGPQIAQP